MRELRFVNGLCPVLIDIEVMNAGGCQEVFIPDIAIPVLHYAQRGCTKVEYTAEPKQKSILINEGIKQCLSELHS